MKKLWSNIGVRVSIITIFINFLLFIFKFLVGIFAHSNAMISDGIHSLSDVLTTIIVIFGLVIASKEADEKHPYGHERVESVFAIILAFMLLMTGVYIGYIGLMAIVYNDINPIVEPGILSLIAAIISIVVKEIMFRYTIRVAKKIKSSSMEADAWHHRSDALSSVGSFLGILGARLGFKVLDSICSLLICILIIKTAIEIFKDSVSSMLDTACDKELQEQLLNTIYSINDSVEIIDFKTRLFGSKIYIDTEIAIDGNTSLKKADKIVKKIHDIVEEEYPIVKHCNIHVAAK